jgi:hypothetical protein
MARKTDDGEVTEVLGSGAPMEDFQSGQFRTRYATEAVDLAEVFKLLIGTTPLRGPVTFHVEMSAPDGPSTGGGVQSVQHVKLVADDGGTTLIAGWCDQMAGTCELRTLDCLDAQHRERFRKSALMAPPLPSERLDRLHYGKLVERLRTFFAERELRVTIVDAPDVPTHPQTLTPAPRRPAKAPSSHFGALLFGAVIGAAVAASVYWWLLRR